MSEVVVFLGAGASHENSASSRDIVTTLMGASTMTAWPLRVARPFVRAFFSRSFQEADAGLPEPTWIGEFRPAEFEATLATVLQDR
jgi:hypothetical protein